MTTTLLAVDDSKTMRKVLEMTFAGEDFRAILAENADDALAKLRSEQPGIALVDATLGDANGYDLCQQLKREAPQVPVLMLTSKHQPYDRARGGTVGADDFIDKPFDTQQLIDKVTTLIQKGTSAARPAAAAPVPAPVVAQPGAQPGMAVRSRAPTLSYGSPNAAPAVPIAPAPAVRPAPAPSFGGAPAQRPAAPAPAARPAAAPAPSFAAKPAQPIQPAVRPAAVANPAASRAPAVAPVAARPAAPAAPAPTAHAPVHPAPAPAAAPFAAAVDGQLAGKLEGLGLTSEQAQAVLALSREVVEKVVWEVVPVLAETMLKEEIARLTAE